MAKHYKTILKSLAFFTIGFVILFFVYRDQNANYLEECASRGVAEGDCSLIGKILTDFSETNYWYVLLILLFFMISNVARALRWQMLLEPISHSPAFVNSIASIMAAYLTNLGIPRSGEFVRAGLLAKYEDIPVEKVMGTVVTDRILDVLCLGITIILAFIVSFKTMFGYFSSNDAVLEKIDLLLSYRWILVGIGIGFMLGLILILRNYKKILASKIGQKILKILKGFSEGLQSVFRLKRPWLFIFYSITIWFMYFSMTYVCFFAYEPTAHLPASAGLVIFVFGTLGIVFPAPGGMGSYHWLISEGLGLYGINGADAFSFANIIFFAVTIFCNILLGIVAFILLPLYNKK